MIWIVAVVLIVIAVAGYLWFGKKTAAPAPQESADALLLQAAGKPQPRYWGKRIVIPDPTRACDAAIDMKGHVYEAGKEPRLPHADCNMAMQCQCHYEPVPEQRKIDRRGGHERREELRFEVDKEDRRSGEDRRSKSYKWHSTV